MECEEFDGNYIEDIIKCHVNECDNIKLLNDGLDDKNCTFKEDEGQNAKHSNFKRK